jgi:Papain-like cysteine protease AvrRpt2
MAVPGPLKLAKRLLVVALAAVVVTGCACTPPANKLLAVTLRPQETSMWCWAASGQMVMEFLGHNVAQGVEANNRFGRTDCTNSPVPSACVLGGWPEFNKYGFTSKHTSNTALTWDQLKSQIGCASKPVAFSWGWTGGGGHMMVAVGYKTQNGVDYVEVNDPWPPNVGTSGNASIKTYSDYVSLAGDHTHWDDYYDVTYTGAP